MERLEKYKGVFPAFYACYDDLGEISPERTKDFVDYLIEKGVKGLYVCGSSGECIYQSVEERKLVLESVMEKAIDKITIIAHVAANNTRDSMMLAAHAQSCGVDGIAAIPPIYFRLPENAIAQYWNNISAAAPSTDFFIYNIPQLAGVALTMNLLIEMFKNPRLVGVKNSSPSVQDIQMFKAEGGNDFIVFNGPDEQYIGGRIMGADGGIGGTYAVMPELFLAAEDFVRQNDFVRAQEVQFAINRIIYALCSCKCNLYAAMKEILKIRGMNIGGVREPLMGTTESDMPIIRTCMQMMDESIKLYCTK